MSPLWIKVPLAKPEEWPMFLCTIVIRLTQDTELPPQSFATEDIGKMVIYNHLNWRETQATYKWPDFIAMGYRFDQAMRFRRQLVEEAFGQLQETEIVRVAPDGLATPDSRLTKRELKPTDTHYGEHPRTGHRQPYRDEPGMASLDSSPDVSSGPEKTLPYPSLTTGDLVYMMQILIKRADVDIHRLALLGKSRGETLQEVHGELLSGYMGRCGPQADRTSRKGTRESTI